MVDGGAEQEWGGAVSWEPLPPTRTDRWLMQHRASIYLVLVLLGTVVVGGVLLLSLRERPEWVLLPVGVYLIAQIGVVHVVLRRAELRLSARRGGGGGNAESGREPGRGGL